MFGRKTDRLAQSQPVGFDHAGIGGASLGLVRGEDHVGGTLAQDAGEELVIRGDPGAGVDHEETDVGHVHRPLGEPPHPALQAVVGGILEAGGVDHGEAQVAQPRLAFAQVAGHARLVVDKGQPFAHEAVEERRFADVGSPDNGEGEGHGIAAPQGQRRALADLEGVRKARRDVGYVRRPPEREI